MEPTYDRLGRRKRIVPVSTGKRVHVTPKDMEMLKAIHHHGPLSSTYLHQFRSPDTSKQATVQRLTVLFNEANTRHGGPYLMRPFQQNQAIDARYNDCVYDLTPAGIEALKEAGEWHDLAPSNRNPWQHAFMIACLTASIELACQKQGYTFMHGHELLERCGASLRQSITFKSEEGERVTKDLIPDALFAIDYGGSFRVFLLEADRRTEPIEPGTMNRKSALRNIRQYEQFVGQKHYKEAWNLTAPLTVLNVTSSESRVPASLKLIENKIGQCAYLVYQSAPEFGLFFFPPPVLYRLMDDDWSRVFKEPFTLKEKPRP